MASSQKAIKIRVGGVETWSAGIDAYFQTLNDPTERLCKTMRFNILKGRPEIDRSDDPNVEQWENMSDADFSRLTYLYDNQFGGCNRNDLRDALNVFMSLHMVNPVVEMLNALPEWDGVNRIERFLQEIMQTEDTPYSHECSRLIFAGGIHRALRPGCKFDDVVVLVGSQGGGKSSIVRMLNVNDEFFRELGTVDGKEAVESISGGWIIEMSEMMAMTSIKEVEGVKSFITRQTDNIRKAYGRFEDELPRRCCFIGTTNNHNFLTDKTGNRRFYPITVNVDGYELYGRQNEVREYIRMCWAQALHRYNNHAMPPMADQRLRDEFKNRQDAARQDDWREGKIARFLETKPAGAKTCVIEVFNACIASSEYEKPTRKDSIEIGKIITSLPDWISTGERVRFDEYGLQRAFCKKSNAMQVVEPPDDIPY